jgi:polyhydroxyalkanoate synthesis regulator phasin
VEKPIVAEGEIATMNAHGYAGELIELTVTDNRGGQAKDTMKIINPVINDISTMQNQISDLQLENQQQDEQITVLQQENQQQQSQITGLDQQLQDLQALVDQIATFPPIERYLRGKDDSGL